MESGPVVWKPHHRALGRSDITIAVQPSGSGNCSQSALGAVVLIRCWAGETWGVNNPSLMAEVIGWPVFTANNRS